MVQRQEQLATCDPVWAAIRDEAMTVEAREPGLAGLLHANILNHGRFECALAHTLSQKLGSEELSPLQIRDITEEAMEDDAAIGEAARADLSAFLDRDPACHDMMTPFLYYKGFHALQAHRIAHWLWTAGRTSLAYYMQHRNSVEFGVDAHPAARIGKGIMIDHATGIVIGETAVIENNVSMLHGVTLGGTGKVDGDRHPKIREGALISVGAQVLGNVEVGARARVGAGSVVLINVPAECTAAGVPAKIVGCAGSKQPAREMRHEWLDKDEHADGSGI
ncbi:MAG: serine O-acetyltransferase [Alphaproteobacteria bacterium]